MNNQLNPLLSLSPMHCPVTGNNCDSSFFNENGKVFLGQSFNNERENRENAVNGALNNHDLQLNMATERQGVILCQVCKKIKESFFCLFDLTEYNQNVLIELGLAIAFKKHVILLYNKNINANFELPSNINNFSRISYNDYGDLEEELNKEIPIIIDKYNKSMHIWNTFNLVKEIMDIHYKTKEIETNPKITEYKNVKGIYSYVFILKNGNNKMKNGMIFDLYYKDSFVTIVHVVNVSEKFSYAKTINHIDNNEDTINNINEEIKKFNFTIEKIQI